MRFSAVLLFGSVAFVYIHLRIHLIFVTYALIVLTTVVLYLQGVRCAHRQ